MSELNFCHSCLSLNVVLNSASTYKTEFERLTNLTVSQFKTQRFCSKCCYHLKKCRMFRDRCLLADRILNDLIENDVGITKESLSTIDRESLTIAFGLTYSQLQHNDIPPSNDSIESVEFSDNVVKHEDMGIKAELVDVGIDDCIIDDFFDHDFIENAGITNTSEVKAEFTLLEEYRPQKKEKTKCLKGKSTPKKQIKTKSRATIQDRAKTYKCTICDKVFNQHSGLARHRRKHTGERPHKCPRCEKSFPVKYTLDSHIKRRHVEERPYQCSVCEKRYPDKPSLKQHESSHSRKKPLLCTLCGKAYSTQTELGNHIRTHTGEQPFACHVCDKRFSNRSVLWSHVRIHSDENPYTCPVCNKRINFRSSFDKHMRTHTGEKPYKCDVCSKQFAIKAGLSSHMRTHTGEEPFECLECGKRFKFSQKLKEHIRTHTGEKPYECPTCARRFANHGNMKKHEKTHAKE